MAQLLFLVHQPLQKKCRSNRVGRLHLLSSASAQHHESNRPIQNLTSGLQPFQARRSKPGPKFASRVPKLAGSTGRPLARPPRSRDTRCLAQLSILFLVPQREKVGPADNQFLAPMRTIPLVSRPDWDKHRPDRPCGHRGISLPQTRTERRGLWTNAKYRYCAVSLKSIDPFRMRQSASSHAKHDTITLAVSRTCYQKVSVPRNH
jgi:hypothetical protein